jgi:hypothetical protein
MSIIFTFPGFSHTIALLANLIIIVAVPYCVDYRVQVFVIAGRTENFGWIFIRVVAIAVAAAFFFYH